MEIDATERYTLQPGEFRYQITVSKSDEKTAEYYLDFKKITQEMRAWFSHVYTDPDFLDNAYAIEFYDIKALSLATRQGRSAFDTYTPMGYTFSERERLFVDGIGKTIIDFVTQYQAKLVFSVPLRPALAKIYDSLLKKHAQRVQYLYKMEFIKDGLYVIEI
ncbi:hypothetical protein [Serratia proteamaculans]|uniref:Uncharacterized protein n=2 Tax=Serratia TaxID=613 RepID=A0A5Q2V372_SERPR|nr:hypothetical protein [Serratia proteamaculans]QGH59827.1 hypothetical protein GHV41_02730 [Serratia proteamaculans]